MCMLEKVYVYIGFNQRSKFESWSKTNVQKMSDSDGTRPVEISSSS